MLACGRDETSGGLLREDGTVEHLIIYDTNQRLKGHSLCTITGGSTAGEIYNPDPSTRKKTYILATYTILWYIFMVR